MVHRGAPCQRALVAKACNHRLSLSDSTGPFSAHRVVEWANNLAEKAILPVAIERRNCIHISSENAGPCVAAFGSIVETCMQLKIHLREYLASVPTRVG